MDRTELASGGELIVGTPEEIVVLMKSLELGALVCLISLAGDLHASARAAIEVMLAHGCDYFVIHGPQAEHIEDQMDSMIESRAPTAIAGADEVPAHATTATVRGNPEDVAAAFIYSSGEQSTSRSTTTWIAILDHNLPDRGALSAALQNEAALA